MGNGTLTHITYPFQFGVLTYRTTATYQCDLGYELEDYSTTNDVYCMQNGSWTPNINCTGKCIWKNIFLSEFKPNNGVMLDVLLLFTHKQYLAFVIVALCSLKWNLKESWEYPIDGQACIQYQLAAHSCIITYKLISCLIFKLLSVLPLLSTMGKLPLTAGPLIQRLLSRATLASGRTMIFRIWA